jgi:hypothetical protein
MKLHVVDGEDECSVITFLMLTTGYSKNIYYEGVLLTYNAMVLSGQDYGLMK